MEIGCSAIAECSGAKMWPHLFHSRLLQSVLNPPTLAKEGAPCIPTYHADGCPPISKAQVVEPTQGCGLSTAHLLPSCPALVVDQRQATRPGTAIMMAIAVPSLSCSKPRVQFWLMLFPADKIQTSSFYSPPPSECFEGEGWSMCGLYQFTQFL